MMTSQRVLIRMSEVREKANGLPQTDGSFSEAEKLRAELVALETEYRAALETEAKSIEGVKFSGETVEHRELLRGSSAAEIISAVAEHRSASGATAELQRELRVGQDVVPWALLSHRAAATFTADAEPSTAPFYLGQPFADSIAEFAGCRIVMVPAGLADFPVLNTGASVEHLTDSTGVTESTAAFVVERLTPRNRYQAGFAVREQDLIAFAGAGDSVTQELRGAVRDRIDLDLLTRAGEGLLTTKADADPPSPGAASTAAAMIGIPYAAVDGLYAQDVSQVRMIVGAGGSGTYQYMGATPSGTGSPFSVAEKIATVSGGLRVSPHVPAYTNDMQEGVACKVGVTPNAVMALFGGGVRIIEDIYTRAAEGERRFHGVMFGDFTVLRADGYSRFRVRTS